MIAGWNLLDGMTRQAKQEQHASCQSADQDTTELLDQNVLLGQEVTRDSDAMMPDDT